jgi:hypothetical protein
MKFGYIYKLTYDALDYYGCSIEKNRFSKHKIDYKLFKEGKTHYKSSYILFEKAEKNGELPTFEILACFYKHFCNRCMREEEQKYIDKYPNINKNNAFRKKNN